MNINEKIAKPPPPKVTSIEPSALVVAPETKTASPTRRYSDTPLLLSSSTSRSTRYDVTNTKFDQSEYFCIWLITIVMALYGMEALMIAGYIAALLFFVLSYRIDQFCFSNLNYIKIMAFGGLLLRIFLLSLLFSALI